MSSQQTFSFPAADPAIGVVVLNWNNPADTTACLDQLIGCVPRPARVVVVDNASDDESLAKIQSWMTSNGQDIKDEQQLVCLIESPKNLGFAGGSNLGIRELLSDPAISHVLLLNNDTVIPSAFFQELTVSLREARDPGILGPTIREYPATEKIWYAGARENFFRGLVLHSLSAPATEHPQPTDFVTGCAMLISRKVLTSIGGLAEQFFPAYFEDGDFCHRAMRAGFSVMYAPRPVIYHKVGSTVRAAGISHELAFAKNRLRVIYVRRNYRGTRKAIALAYLAVTKPVRSIVEVFKGEPRYAWQVFRGTLSGFLARNIA